MDFNTNKSLVNYQRKVGAKINLVCFANAGSGVPLFRQWHTFFDDTVDVWGASYPGRDTLSNEDPVSSMKELIPYYIEDLSLYRDREFVLYGHSFGALVVFMLAVELQRKGIRPAAVCVGARRAPSMQTREKIAFDNDKKLVEQLKKFGGIPDLLLEDSDLLMYFLPHIRHDLFLNEQSIEYAYEKVQAPVFSFSSPSDFLVLPREIRAWGDHTDELFESISLSGGHFFINENKRVFFDHMRKIIDKTVV